MRKDFCCAAIYFASTFGCGPSDEPSPSIGTTASAGVGGASMAPVSTSGTTSGGGETASTTVASVGSGSSSGVGTTGTVGTGGSGPAAGTGGSAGGSGGASRDGATADAASDGGSLRGDASIGGTRPPTGPFTCTELIGLFSTGEWWDAGFHDGLGADLKTKWQGRFAHYGYTYEYAKPDSYAWSPVNVGGTNNVRITAPCAQNGSAPDRIVYQAWTWELTTEETWVQSLEAALATIRSKRPSAKRIDIMTIIRCPMNLWCRADKPPLGPNTDHDATKQDCHVPEYIDSAFAKVAAAHPDLVTVVPPFEAHACAMAVDGIHLHEQTGPVAADIAAYFKTMP